MARLRSLILLGMIGTMHCIAAWGQACYTPIKSWQGSYTLSTSASGVTCPAGGNGVCDIGESSAANVSTILSSVSSCSTLTFYGPDSPTLLSFNSSGTFPCDPVGSQTITIQSDPGGTSTTLLTLNVANNTYTYQPAPVANITTTDTGCGGGSTTTTGPGPMYPPPVGWPPALGLPATVGSLTLTNSFPGLDSAFLADVTWQWSFSLNPVYDDCEDCKKAGAQGFPASSSISAQNQSLSEDIPIVGTGFRLHYESNRTPGAGGGGIATAAAAMLGGWTLNVNHSFDPGSNTLFLGDGGQRNGYQLGTPVTFNGNLLVTSEDGREVYAFDLTTGHHVQTLRSMTGAIEYQFGYDSAGELVTITDSGGNVTTIQRDASEHPLAIVAPFGQTTSLSLDSNGFLNQATDPAGNTEKFSYSPLALMNSRTDANGNQSSYSYDAQGRLSKDADSIGGSVTLGRTVATSGFGSTVSETTSMGRISSYQTTVSMPWVQNGSLPYSEQHANIWPNGLHASETRSVQNGQLTRSTTLPDGTTNTETVGPDPRFGLQWPVLTSETLKQGNLTMSITGSRTANFTAGNPFSLTTQTDTKTINGRSYTSVFTTSTGTWLDTSPMNRTTTTVLDSLERISSVQAGSLLPIQFAYDTNGRVKSITQGTRVNSLSYDTNGLLASVTDPLNQTTNFTYDAAGRLSTRTLPDGRSTTYTYDGNGNLASVIPPGRSAHDFSYDAVDLLSSYTPPAVVGTGASSYSYNTDRDPVSITRPDGETIKFGYDGAGRLSSTTTPSATIKYTYNSKTGNLSTASITGGEGLSYGYNGPLPTSTILSGLVAGTVSRAYNNNFWVASESINGSNTVNFTYDKDGLITKAGTLTISRDPNDGLVKATTLGGAIDSRTFNTFGELVGYTAKFKVGATSTTLYAVTYTRDAGGRISGKTETIGGKKNTYIYSYDHSGRITGVKKNGVAISTYGYDSNSNRLTATTSSGTVVGTYDAQDRLLTYGTASYSYTANGELESQTTGSQTTTYTYDVLGNLLAVKLPNATQINYLVDAKERRVGKQVNGALVAGYLYDGNRIVAQLNSANQIVSQFVYGSGSTFLDYMIQSGVTYRIFSDQLGSPRLVVNTATGVIAEEIDYDEFGNVINDTNPGFQPFGFAGGLYDQDTKFVRFGARDYDGSTGRWTTKDPIRFAGKDTNLYGYAFNDPVNLADPSGLDSWPQWYQDAVHAEQRARKWIASKLCSKCQEQNSDPPEQPGPEKEASEPGNTIKKIADYVRNVGIEAIVHWIGELNESSVGHVAGPAVTAIEGTEAVGEALPHIFRHNIELKELTKHDEVQEQCPNQ